MVPKLYLELILVRKSVCAYLEIPESHDLKDIGTYFDAKGKHGDFEGYSGLFMVRKVLTYTFKQLLSTIQVSLRY